MKNTLDWLMIDQKLKNRLGILKTYERKDEKKVKRKKPNRVSLSYRTISKGLLFMIIKSQVVVMEGEVI